MFGKINQRLPSGIYVPSDVLNGAIQVADNTQSGVGIWQNGPRSMQYGLYEADTFHNGFGTTTTSGFKTISSNSGGTTSVVQSSERPGVVNVVCTGNGNIAGLLGISVQNRVSRANETHEVSWWMKTPANLATSGDDYTLNCGLRDVGAGATNYAINAQYKNSLGTTFNLLTNNNGATTTTAGRTPVAISTWYRLRFRIRILNAAAGTGIINFYLTPQGQTERLEVSFQGTVPPSGMAASLVLVKNSATGTIFTVAADGWEWWSSYDAPF